MACVYNSYEVAVLGAVQLSSKAIFNSINFTMPVLGLLAASQNGS